jgi:hypothetical protein
MIPPEGSRDPIESAPSVIRGKVCEACGETFECRAGACWCDTVALTDETRARLRVRYADCLCPACLGNATESMLSPGRLSKT